MGTCLPAVLYPDNATFIIMEDDDVVESVCLAEMQDVHDCGDATAFQGLGIDLPYILP